MRILVTTSNWAGHYYSMVPLCWALQGAGHEVRVACMPEQADAISRTGLTAVPVLDGLDQMFLARVMLYLEAAQGRRTMPGVPVNPVTGADMDSIDQFDMTAARASIRDRKLAAMRRSYDGAVTYARHWSPDLVLHDPMSLEGALVGRVLKVPSVQHSWGLMGTVEADPGLYLGPADPSGSFDRYGVGPFDRNQIRHVIDSSPAGLEPPTGDARRLPIRYVPYNGPSVAAPTSSGDGSGRPRVCVIWGNSATGMFGLRLSALPRIVEALSGMDVDVVVTSNQREIEAVGTVGESVRLLVNAPLHLLLDGADLVIHHGSANCSMTAGYIGVPQLALAMSGEQQALSERFDTTGASRTLPGASATVAEIRNNARTLLADSVYRTAAQRLRDTIRGMPAPADLVDALEELAATGDAGLSEHHPARDSGPALV